MEVTKNMEMEVEKVRSIPKERGSKDSDVWIVLLKDLGSFALYFNKSNNCFCGFEVNKIRIRKARTSTIQGRTFTVPERRVLASSEEFGTYALHFPNINLVYERYPQFLKYESDIETQLSIGLQSIDNAHRRGTSIVTMNVRGKVSGLSHLSNGTPQNNEGSE